jgi:hypothetical protein
MIILAFHTHHRGRHIFAESHRNWALRTAFQVQANDISIAGDNAASQGIIVHPASFAGALIGSNTAMKLKLTKPRYISQS